MKRLFLTIIISSLFGGVLSAQTLIEQIERAYRTLDSTAYVDDVILSYAKSLDELNKEFRETDLEVLCLGADSTEFEKRILKVDSMYDERKASNAQRVKEFENDVKSETPFYVLNLKIKDKHTLQVDTGKLNFNLFYFDKKYKGRLYVYCDNGKYCGHDIRFENILNQKVGRNAPKAFRRIMRKHPKYLLHSDSCILYVLDDTIYVYNILKLKEYTLDEYLKKNTLIHYLDRVKEAQLIQNSKTTI